MLRKTAGLTLAILVLVLASCARNGGLRNPFTKEAPFVPSAVPADFTIIVDEQHDTYYARQHIQQVITTGDAMSRTTYTTFRDLNNVVSGKFVQETPLSAVQLQNMWNETVKHGLMEGAHTGIDFLSDADIHKQDSYIIQIRANGASKTYKQQQGFSMVLRPVMLQVEAVRLPISQDSKTHVIGATAAEPAPAPATIPAVPATDSGPSLPTTAPATAPMELK